MAIASGERAKQIPSQRRLKGIPQIPGWPFLGSALPFKEDPIGFIKGNYRKLGPVYQMALPAIRPIMVLGPSANRFMRTQERANMLAKPAFAPLGKALGAERFLMAMDGEEHSRLRAIYAQCMGAKELEGYLPAFCEHAERFHAGWLGSGAKDPSKYYKRLVYRQLAAALSPLAAEDEFGHVVRVFDTAVKIGVARIWPQWVSQTPWVLHSQAVLGRLGKRLMVAAKQDPAKAGWAGLVLQAAEEGLLGEEDLTVSLLSPYFAGIDTVTASLSYGGYVLATKPNVVAALRAELDGAGPGAWQSLAGLRKLRVLRAFVQELLRVYTAGIVTFRHAARDLEFEGYHLPKGAMLGFSPVLPHYLEECFEQPEEFRLERWLGKRPCSVDEYQPYGTGAHMCLGAGVADLQLLITFARIVTSFDMHLADPHYQLEKAFEPLLTPKGLKLYVTSRSQP